MNRSVKLLLIFLYYDMNMIIKIKIFLKKIKTNLGGAGLLADTLLFTIVFAVIASIFGLSLKHCKWRV